MSWSKYRAGGAGSACRAGLLSLSLLLGACATTDPASEHGQAQSQVDAVQAAFAEAVALKRAGELGPAESLFLDLSRDHPDLTGPLVNLGIIARERGDGEQAKVYFKQVIALDPEHPQARNELGVLARQRGDFAAAEAHYRQALAGAPEFQPALKNLAILLELYQGRLQEALELVERYAALQPTPEPGIEDWLFDLRNRMN